MLPRLDTAQFWPASREFGMSVGSGSTQSLRMHEVICYHRNYTATTLQKQQMGLPVVSLESPFL